MKNLVAFFEITASDFGRAIQFYETILGLKLSPMEWETEKMAFFPEESGQYPGAISSASGFNPSKDGVLVSLSVNNMEQTLLAIEQNAGKIVIPKTKIEATCRGYFAVFIDSEGNKVGLYSDK